MATILIWVKTMSVFCLTASMNVPMSQTRGWHGTVGVVEVIVGGWHSVTDGILRRARKATWKGFNTRSGVSQQLTSSWTTPPSVGNQWPQSARIEAEAIRSLYPSPLLLTTELCPSKLDQFARRDVEYAVPWQSPVSTCQYCRY